MQVIEVQAGDLAPDHQQRLREELDALATPLVTHIKEIAKEIEGKDLEIANIQAEIKSLRETRNSIAFLLRRINPDLVPAEIKVPGSATVGKKRAKRHDKRDGLGQEKRDQLSEFVQTHREELNSDGGFSITTLLNQFPELGQIASKSALGKTLTRLHEDGILHLDHANMGRPSPGRPTGKFYRVV